MPPLRSLKKIKNIQMQYYSDAHNAGNNGKPVAYLNVFTPVELLYALDIFPIYPENHAAVVGVRKMTPDVSPAAENLGYSMDLCSYPRCDIGSVIAELSPTWGLPKPDILVVSNAQCGTIPKWFEVLSRMFDVPMVLIDVPHSDNGEADPAAERYVRAQLDDLVKTLEGLAGRTLDRDRLAEVVNLSDEATNLWSRILEAAARTPAPITVFDQFIAMAPIVSQRGTQAAVDFYRDMVEELEERAAAGVGAVDDERFRLYWDNLPMWPELRRFSTYLNERGIGLVTSIYTWAWTRLGVSAQDPFNDWTRQYLYDFNFHFDKRVEQYVQLAQDYDLDGFVYHSNRSCKWLSQDIPEVRKAVAEKTGKPGVIIEGDQCDPRLYSMDEIESRIDNFLDLLRARKE
jgi:benzoyl-CoA reductase/2-hydroxyglutaryl-CoA dehydratase subunit BcrC/BadD/HgdB